MPTFRSNKLSPSSALKTVTVCFAETLQPTDEFTWRQNPDEHHHPHHCENLKSHFSPEHTDSIFLQKAGIYQWVYTAPKPRRATSLSSHLCACVLLPVLSTAARDHSRYILKLLMSSNSRCVKWCRRTKLGMPVSMPGYCFPLLCNCSGILPTNWISEPYIDEGCLSINSPL
jgi:hypothetical protein